MGGQKRPDGRFSARNRETAHERGVSWLGLGKWLNGGKPARLRHGGGGASGETARRRGWMWFPASLAACRTGTRTSRLQRRVAVRKRNLRHARGMGAGPVFDRPGQPRAVCRPCRRPAYFDGRRKQGRKGNQSDLSGAADVAASVHLHRPERRTGDDHGLAPGPGLGMGGPDAGGPGPGLCARPFSRVTGPAELTAPRSILWPISTRTRMRASIWRGRLPMPLSCNKTGRRRTGRCRRGPSCSASSSTSPR